MSSQELVTPLSDEERNAAIRLVCQFFGLLVGLGFAAKTIAHDPSSFLKSALPVIPWTLDPEYICGIFLFIHGVRFWLGLTFLDSDESFLVAMRRKFRPNSQKDQRRKKIDIGFRIAALLSVVLLVPGINGHFSEYGLVIIMWINSTLLVGFDKLYWDVLFKLDRQKAANMFIFVGDMTVILFTLIITVFVFVAPYIQNYSPNFQNYSSALLMFTLGSLVAVFLGEIRSQYLEALLVRIRAIRP